MPTITISLPDSLKEFIQERVEKDGFGTVSEYLRDLIREDRKRKAQHQLESLLMAGLGTEVSEMTSTDWDDIRREVRRRHKPRKPIRP